MPSTHRTMALLSPELVALVDSGVSTIVASRDGAQRPSLMRAVGSGISATGDQITVFLDAMAGRQVLQDLQATGAIAVVFSEPSTNRTFQVKARSATCRCGMPSDLECLKRYRLAMEHQLQIIGIAPAFTGAMLAFELDRLVAISFRPEQAFDQTPGPRAGAQLPLGTTPS